MQARNKIAEQIGCNRGIEDVAGMMIEPCGNHYDHVPMIFLNFLITTESQTRCTVIRKIGNIAGGWQLCSVQKYVRLEISSKHLPGQTGNRMRAGRILELIIDGVV